MNTETNTNTPAGQDTLSTNKRIQSAAILVLILLGAFLFASTINALKEYRYIGGGIAPSNAITVSGEGEVFAVPDTAEFTFTITEEGATVGEVQDAASEKADRAISALKEAGIEERDIKTLSYDLHPKYEWQPAVCVRFPCERTQVQVGFTLNQSVRVKVRDIDTAGDMLALVTDAEVQSVSSLSFTVADEDGLKAEARKLAIDEAQAKAERLAQDLGVSLVRVVGFSEDHYWPMYGARSQVEAIGLGDAAMAPSAPVLPTGENRVTSNVNITYEIR
jgi:uncharacterized protein